MKSLSFFICLFFVHSLHSQTVVNVDKVNSMPANTMYGITSQPFINTKFVRLVDGSQYFKDEWLKARAIASEGTVYASPQVRLDLVDHLLHFLNEQGQEMVSTSQLKEVFLTDTVNNLAYHFIHSQHYPALATLKKGWYQQLADGPASLYKFYNKILLESKPYNASTIEQRINTSAQYYLVMNNSVQLIKKLKDLAGMFPANGKEIEAYLKTLDAKAPLEEKIAAAVAYYNSLQ